MTINGLIQDVPLMISSLIEHAAQGHGSREIVSRLVDGTIHRTTYAQVHERAKKLATALRKLDVAPGDRVATLAWNTHRHFELFYAVSGTGSILHTVNPRLFEEQITYIINHAEDVLLFVDTDQLPLVEKLVSSFNSIRGIVVLCDKDAMPETSLPGVLCYEALLAGEAGDYDWPEFDERSASSLCYTSGTTGNPKGVLYSHRSTLLHSLSITSKDALGLSAEDSIMLIAPMFHANGWSLPYCSAALGAKLVLPGRRMEPEYIYELMTAERTTFAAAVPAVWNMLIEYLDKTGKRLDHLERCLIAGVAVPQSMREKLRCDHGVEVIQMWGMTEMSPIGTLATPTPEINQLPAQKREAILDKQGRRIFGVEMKIVDDDGSRLPHDGEAFGDVWVRGPCIASGYFKAEGGQAMDAEGWFPTGDVGTLDQYGYFKITDRSKDVIKSGGEWISSVDIENFALSHPQVVEAAVVGVDHPKWDERPVLIVRPADEEHPPGKEDLIEHLKSRIANWWLPDDVVFISEMPYTATGKIKKLELREQYRNHLTGQVARVNRGQ